MGNDRRYRYRRLLWAGLALGMLLAGCGYRMAGPGELPGKANTVAVTMLVNRSGESGLEAKVTNALLDEITRRRQDLVVSVEQADAILTGTIDNLSTQTAARSGTLTATERKVVITVSLTLKDRGGEVLWQGARLTAEQAFLVADTKPQTESNRRAAMNEVAKRLAEYAYERLTDNF
ncbi:MAG: LptE family protein [Desulfatitalea sp.]|nr:LptE family protein [Desulfatitalea sp.]MBI5895501.1 LptE family protein [Desulfobacterales bacterium]